MGILKSKKFLVSYKLFFGLLAFAALVTEVATLLDRGIFNAANFFSYFTVLTNSFIAIILFASAIATAANKNDKLRNLRGAATMYGVIVGVIFPALLSGLQGVQFTAVPFDNLILHYVMPVAILVDFLIDRPKKITFKRGLVWLLFPAAYAVYSLIRGPIVGWYPYPFLNPSTNGYEGVAIVSLGIVALSLALTYGITWLTRKK